MNLEDKAKIDKAKADEAVANKASAEKASSIKYNTCISSFCRTTCANWNISPLLPGNVPCTSPYAILILNRPIAQDPEYMIPLWNNATIRVTVDGGTTNWDIFLNKLEPEIKDTMKIPDMITGDFDSVTNTILERYKNNRSEVIHTPDQSHTDFTKALMVLDERCKQKKIDLSFVLVIGQASGRIDQILSNIHTLFLAREKKLFGEKTALYFMADDAVSWLLNPGCHRIGIPQSVRDDNDVWCSLVPIGDVCEQITTSGLKWNLDKHCLKFGDLVSTSNTYTEVTEAVIVDCSHTLLWSMKLPISLRI